MRTSAETKQWCSYMAGMSCACPARSRTCCLGLYRGKAVVVPFYAARVADLGPGDFVRVECACGHIERLTAVMLTAAGVAPDSKVQDLGYRMRCRECDEKGRAVISIRWAKE